MTVHNWETFSGSKVFFDEGDNATFISVDHYGDNNDWGGEIIHGGDRRILQAARVSNKGQNTGMTTQAKDIKLLQYLWRNKHVSPFEQVHLTFTVVTDLRTAMQMDTHRTITKNRYSRRYAADWVEFVRPVWRKQNSEGNKQGSDEQFSEFDQLGWLISFKKHCENSEKLYNDAIQAGMAREQAAWFLPTGTLTSTFYTVSVRHLIDFIWTRCESHAQREIQAIAYVLKNEVLPLTNPWVYQLLCEEFELKGWEQDYEK
jgi:thymidylate synthase (FAD)